jgi:lipoate-protein ligase B
MTGISTENRAGDSGIPGELHQASTKVCIAHYLGVIPYERALRLQEALALARARGMSPDFLLLLQHPHTFTIGRFKGEEDMLVSGEVLAREAIAVFHTNRGGGVTYHGPGQLIGYPVLSLRENGLTVREYIQKLEATIIALLLGFGISGYRDADYPGVWVGGEKICSVGIHVSRGITMHGFALNVNTDLRYFEYINPCGLRGKVMTSLSKVLGYDVETEAVVGPLLSSFSAVFGLEMERRDTECLATLDARTG